VGYFVVRAESIDRARAIAASCPHLKYRGRVVLRPLT